MTTVSGMLSKPGLAVWSASPPAAAGGPLLADLAAEAAAATEVVPVVDAPPADATPATVASFTVTYGGDDGSRAGAHGHRGGPARWGPHRRHLRRCRRPPASPSPRASSGGRVEVKDTTFSL